MTILDKPHELDIKEMVWGKRKCRLQKQEYALHPRADDQIQLPGHLPHLLQVPRFENPLSDLFDHTNSTPLGLQ